MSDSKKSATASTAALTEKPSNGLVKGPRAFLRDLYRLNQLYAQMVLYKDYINLTRKASLDVVTTSKFFDDLEEHLHRYCK
jgi:hypothetical protein